MASSTKKAEGLTLIVDGKGFVDIKNASKMSKQLNKALTDQGNFAEFARNPKLFVAKYNISIDNNISNQIAKKLKGVTSLAALNESAKTVEAEMRATFWAVVSPYYSVSSTKIAIAF